MFRLRSLTLLRRSFLLFLLPYYPLACTRCDFSFLFFLTSCFHLSIHPSNPSPKIITPAGWWYSRRLAGLVPFLLATFSSFLQSHSHPTTPMPSPQTQPHAQRGPPVQHAPQPACSSSPAPTSQFFYLNLSLPWSTTSPAWVQLRPGPRSAHLPGTTSADGKNLFFFRIPGSNPVYQFSLETGNWSPHAQTSFVAPIEEGIGAVTDPNTDLV